MNSTTAVRLMPVKNSANGDKWTRKNGMDDLT